MWDMLLQKHEENIPNTFRLHEYFIQMANRKMHTIRQTLLKFHGTSARQTNKTKLARRKKFRQLIYVGSHVR